MACCLQTRSIFCQQLGKGRDGYRFRNQILLLIVLLKKAAVRAYSNDCYLLRCLCGQVGQTI